MYVEGVLVRRKAPICNSIGIIQHVQTHRSPDCAVHGAGRVDDAGVVGPTVRVRVAARRAGAAVAAVAVGLAARVGLADRVRVYAAVVAVDVRSAAASKRGRHRVGEDAVGHPAVLTLKTKDTQRQSHCIPSIISHRRGGQEGGRGVSIDSSQCIVSQVQLSYLPLGI